MSVVTVLMYAVCAVAGYLLRHYQTPAHHKIVDAALAEQAEAKAKDMVKGLFASNDKPADKPAA